jgi:hypothetical protein
MQDLLGMSLDCIMHRRAKHGLVAALNSVHSLAGETVVQECLTICPKTPCWVTHGSVVPPLRLSMHLQQSLPHAPCSKRYMHTPVTQIDGKRLEQGWRDMPVCARCSTMRKRGKQLFQSLAGNTCIMAALY